MNPVDRSLACLLVSLAHEFPRVPSDIVDSLIFFESLLEYSSWDPFVNPLIFLARNRLSSMPLKSAPKNTRRDS